MLLKARKELWNCGSREKAAVLQGFFKTGPGEYAEGDKFIGARVSDTRKISRKYADLPDKAILDLLHSAIHEERLLALLILISRFEKAEDFQKEKIFRFYLKNTRYINNWDLVDLSAHKIVGAFLNDKNKKPLYRLAKSKLIWERRIAIVSCFYFIKRRKYEDTLKILALLLFDKEDLIHKAAGWMLREVGKRDQNKEEEFLKKHAHYMPRTMLRSAIEKFSEEKRKYYTFRGHNT